ncbi:MAG: hypothetical protein K9G46_15510 [Flavobacteriales bacterium]|nr:hypothetical protein [Flavobacteriales bacterium]
MKVTHENMMGFVLESLGVELASSVEDKAIWKDVDGNQISQDIEISNNHRVVSSHIRYGETVSLELNGFGITRGSSVQITIVFDSPVLSALRINPEGLRFSMTAKGDSIETPSFKIPLGWYDESKENYDYTEHGTKLNLKDRLRLTAIVETGNARIQLNGTHHLVPVTYRRNYEESIGLFKKEKKEDKERREKEAKDPPPKDLDDNYENYFISLNSKIKGLVGEFVDFMQSDGLKLESIQERVEKDAKQLWIFATEQVQAENGSLDDRPLYWARNKMQVALKRHPLFKGGFNPITSQVLPNEKNEDCKQIDLYCLIKRFEELSRNYTGISFEDAKGDKEAQKKIQDAERALAAAWAIPLDDTEREQKIADAEAELEKAKKVFKILITGFDPFFLNEFDHQFKRSFNILQSNPSGCVSLSLHGKSLGQGYIQTMMIPVRYTDFDSSHAPKHGQGTGIMEKYVGEEWLENVDMIITVSQTPDQGFNIDAFATRTRGGLIDNMNFERGTGSYIKPNGSATIKTNLPSAMELPPGRVWDKYYLTRDDSDKKKNQKTIERDGFPSGDVYSGPGGNYLSNEIFYRVAELRKLHNVDRIGEENRKELMSGHLHIKQLQFADNQDTKKWNESKMQSSLNDVISIVTNGIKQLSDA